MQGLGDNRRSILDRSTKLLHFPSSSLFLLVFNIVLILMSILFNTCRSRPTTCAAGHLWNFPCVSMRWSSKSRYHHQASAKISSIYAANKYIDIMTLPHRRIHIVHNIAFSISTAQQYVHLSISMN